MLGRWKLLVIGRQLLGSSVQLVKLGGGHVGGRGELLGSCGRHVGSGGGEGCKPSLAPSPRGGCLPALLCMPLLALHE